MTLQFFYVLNIDSLKTRLRKACLFVALTATACLTLIFGTIAEDKSGLSILWIALFPAFWIALRFACLMAWKTSFKKSWVRIPASPQQVLITCVLFFAPAVAFHSYVTAIAIVGSKWPVGGAMIFMAIPIYFFAFLLGLYVIYFPLLALVLVLSKLARNRTLQADAQTGTTNGDSRALRAAERER